MSIKTRVKKKQRNKETKKQRNKETRKQRKKQGKKKEKRTKRKEELDNIFYRKARQGFTSNLFIQKHFFYKNN